MFTQLGQRLESEKFPKFYIYKLIFESGKSYVGQHTQYVEDDGYVTSSSYYKRNKNIDPVRSREILIFVDDTFTLDLLETICIFADKAENGSKNVNYNWGGYANGMVGGWNKGIPMNESTKKKISETCKLIPHQTGFKHTVETKEKMSKAHKGFRHTEESKQKISNSKLGHVMDDYTKQRLLEANLGKTPWNKGKKATDEVKKKLSESHKGQIPWNKGIKMTEEQRKKSSEAHKGQLAPNKGCKWYNNGVVNKMFKEPPDDTWVLGMIRH